MNGVAGQSAILVNCFEALSRIHGFLLWSIVSLWRTGVLACCRRLRPRGQNGPFRIRVIVVGPPEPRQVAAEVQFEIARHAVTQITDLGTARPRTGPRQG